MIQLLEDGERTILVVRKHWFVLFRDMAVLLSMYALPLIAYLFLISIPLLAQDTAIPSFVLPTNILFFLFTAWTFIAWIRLFSVWTDYYLDSWTLTNKRIIDIEQRGYFSRSVGSFRIERIQDVTIVMDGVLQNLLNFGTIRVETAGGDIHTFVMVDIANPKEVKEHIGREVDRVIEQGNALHTP